MGKTISVAKHRPSSLAMLALVSLIVGVASGLLGAIFRLTLEQADRFRDSVLVWAHSEGASGLLSVIGSAATATALAAWLVRRYSRYASGSGIPHVKGVLLHVRAMPWKSLLPVKFLGGLLGIGAGLSMGREGPTVQMGAAVGRMMADTLHVPSRTVPQLLSCGAGAGLAAAFNAPLAGFLFVIEELHRELSARTFAGALVAALAADIITRAFSGDAPSFEITGYPALPLAALPMAALIGVAGGALGNQFRAPFHDSEAQEQKQAEHQQPGRLHHADGGDTAEHSYRVQASEHDHVDQDLSLQVERIGERQHYVDSKYEREPGRQ